jgi:predicted RNA methylase
VPSVAPGPHSERAPVLPPRDEPTHNGSADNGHVAPTKVTAGAASPLAIPKGDFDRLTHYLFRYPAKFHPPVASTLIELFTTEGDLVLDPFCGSGTLLVEAAVAGRPSMGMDIDPLAVAVSEAKTHRFRASHLAASGATLVAALRDYARPAEEYERRKFTDLTDAEYADELQGVSEWVPAIPNLLHWFRRYVVIDLAFMRAVIETAPIPETHRRFFRVVFASIIRTTSNADPVPVSGLEVTKWMVQREKNGRLVDPFSLYTIAQTKAIEAATAFTKSAKASTPVRVFAGDATAIGDYLDGTVDAVITSPPYHSAVDYYRRHQLEMYWIGLAASHAERVELLHHYVGRPKVPKSHPLVRTPLETSEAKAWEDRIRTVSDERADAFHHYIAAMRSFFTGLTDHVTVGAPAILVVGHSDWNGTTIPTTLLFEELAGTAFTLHKVLCYPVKNRYMSYERHNNASISEEYVLVFRRH